MTFLRAGAYHVLFAVLLGGALSSTAVAQDRVPPPHEALRTVDSLRTVGDFRTALGQLNALSHQHPESVEVLWRYAVLWSDYGKATDSERKAVSAHKQALIRADQALQADSTSAWAHLSKAVAAGRAAIVSSSNKARIQLSRTVKEHADRAIALDSTLAPAYHVRGVWHKEVADLGGLTRIVVRAAYGGLPDASFERAVLDFQRAIKLKPHVHNHLELGATYIKMGRTEAAREQLRMALDGAPSDPFALNDKLKARRLLDGLG